MTTSRPCNLVFMHGILANDRSLYVRDVYVPQCMYVSMWKGSESMKEKSPCSGTSALGGQISVSTYPRLWPFMIRGAPTFTLKNLREIGSPATRWRISGTVTKRPQL